MDTAHLEDIAKRIRYDILEITHKAGSGHPTSCMSSVDLMTVLYFSYLKYDAKHPKLDANDRVIFSKGHCSALLYSLYAAAGVISPTELRTYREFQSPLEGHPMPRFPHVEVATGSLGQGLGMGAGEAFAARKVKSSQFIVQSNTKSISPVNPEPITLHSPHVFVLLGDGELAEGSNWEAAAWANHHKLENLIAIVDVNTFGQSEETMYGDKIDIYRQRFASFGWATTIIDGHDYLQISDAIQKAIQHHGGPSVILAKTIKGKGVPLWEGKNGWHNKMLPKEELSKVLEQYKQYKDVAGDIQKPDTEVRSLEFGVQSKTSSSSAKNPKPITQSYTGLVMTKKAFGNALERLGTVVPELLVLDGDMSNSTHTDQYKKTYPDRFLQMYIAEQNMVSVAVGLAKRGMKPFISTFAAFLTRAHDQFRIASLSGVDIRVNGAYGGVSMGKDGPSQMGLEDIALFRSLPASTVLYPVDPYQTEYLVGEMLNQKGISYIRTTREPTPVLYDAKEKFPIGGSKVHMCAQFPESKDQSASKKEVATIVGAGITVIEALTAQKQLLEKGIAVRVIDCYSIKPIDTTTIRKAADETGHIIVVEDHYPEGGLGEAVRMVLDSTKPVKFTHLAVRKTPMSGTAAELLRYEDIDAEAIVSAVL